MTTAVFLIYYFNTTTSTTYVTCHASGRHLVYYHVISDVTSCDGRFRQFHFVIKDNKIFNDVICDVSGRL